MNINIAVIKGDGIGPEIVTEAIKVLNKVADKYNHTFNFKEVLAGGSAIDALGTNLPEETLNVCKNSDAVLLGAVGGPKWDNLPGPQRPEKALLNIRKELGLFSNLRPAVMFDELSSACPLKPEIIDGGLDIMIVRELTGGIYFGKKFTKGNYACDCMEYNRYEIERIVKQAFEIAMKRNKKLTSVDKSNVLETSRMWRDVVEKMKPNYPDVEVNHMYVDNAAMQLVSNPKQFDVMVTENMFGDILSDAASMLTGSLGMLPSASLNETGFGMYEPSHGSAPDIAGTGKANPIATILSAAMMLKFTFNMQEEADCIENAVKKAISDGYRTADIATAGENSITTNEMGDIITSNI